MKFLKILLALVGVLLIIGLVLIFTGPKNYIVSRTLVIHASDSIAFDFVSKFSKAESWSPWKEMDAKAQYSIEGIDGTVGSVQRWTGGDPEITGTGTMTLTEVLPNTKVAYDLHFTAPRDMKSQGGFTLEPLEVFKTKVTWYDKSDIPALQRPFMFFIDLDKIIGDSFERGLFKLDSLATIVQNKQNAENNLVPM